MQLRSPLSRSLSIIAFAPKCYYLMLFNYLSVFSYISQERFILLIRCLRLVNTQIHVMILKSAKILEILQQQITDDDLSKFSLFQHPFNC